ncbi:MAG: TonB-dependent receptor, partial [Verrucomicrobia bacterium]|nr:TonB-dependent receptor [Verrucomicrobiota bacterium]
MRPEMLNKGASGGRAPRETRRATILAVLAGLASSGAWSATGTVTLPGITVYSPWVANQASAGAMAMPISALRYEPRVDIHGRNLAEGQADVTVRGGTFENVGFQLGAATISDPQTGHYHAELPVAPVLLSAPRIVTGAELATRAANASGGVVAYTWRPARTAGLALVSVGQDRLRRAEFHQGFVRPLAGLGGRVGVDLALAHSKSAGAIAHGDHEFNRANLRLQRVGSDSQTDVFAGYQGKRFGWPNLYTPFNSNETENLQTALLAFNHRRDQGGGDHVEAGVFHRRHKDDYAFNRQAPLGPVHPFQHTTWLRGATLGGRQTAGGVAVDYRAEVLADEIKSTALTGGRFKTRTTTKLAVVAAKQWPVAGGGEVALRAGATHDDTNRDPGEFAPVAELARTFPGSGIRRLHVSYLRTSQVPTYTALNSSPTAGLFRGNPGLGRSAADHFEAGVSGAWARWTGEATAFVRRDHALVDWTFRRGVIARTANPVDIVVTGFEGVARGSWAAGEIVL